nr:uncharacterized protein LOC126534172 [Dermacentor andersoni]
MAFVKSVVAVIGLAIVCRGAPVAEENCNFLDEHLERAIDSFIEKLPAGRSKTLENDFPPVISKNIEFKFLGLNSFRPFGPFLTFCRNGSRFVQFDLVNKRPLILVGTQTNDTNTHEILSRALLVRFTGQFEVEGAGEDLKIYFKENVPVSMVGLNMILRAADKEKKEDARIVFSTPNLHFLLSLWNGMLYSVLDTLFTEILGRK